MKKRVMMLLLAGCMTLGTLFTGCGSLGGSEETVASVKADKADKEEESKDSKKIEKNDDSEEEEETEETEDKEKKKKKKSSAPVLGGKDVEGYEGFEYLYEEVLMTDAQEDEETGKMTKEQLTVYIPKGEYSSADRDRAYAEKLGVEFTVSLNPYLQYEQEDYSAEENLEVYLEDEFDEFYITDYKDFEMSEVEKVNGDDACATVKYCKYDSWDEAYNVYYTTFYVRELSPETMVLVEVQINSGEAAEKTQDLLDEISAFYEFDVNWDKKEAEKKLENYLENGNGDSDEFSTGYLKFNLPEGWEKDEYNSNYDTDIYAPGGDVDNAECGIAFVKEYVGSDSGITQLIDDTDIFESVMEELFGEELDDFTAMVYGDTVIGNTALLTFSYTVDDETAYCEMYLAEQDGYLYGIQTIESGLNEEDPVEVARDILENGKLR